jgi:hypothetical protein
MDLFALALVALTVSYLINKTLLERLGEKAICFGAPIVEEIAKTLPAYFMDRSIFHVHFLFGLGEAIYDFCNSGKDMGVWAGLMSALTHSVFGLLTVIILNNDGSIFIALAGSMVLHACLNTVVMRWGRRKRNG